MSTYTESSPNIYTVAGSSFTRDVKNKDYQKMVKEVLSGASTVIEFVPS